MQAGKLLFWSIVTESACVERRLLCVVRPIKMKWQGLILSWISLYIYKITKSREKRLLPISRLHQKTSQRCEIISAQNTHHSVTWNLRHSLDGAVTTMETKFDLSGVADIYPKWKDDTFAFAYGIWDCHGQDSLHDRYNSTSIEELKCNLFSDIALCPLSSTLIQ